MENEQLPVEQIPEQKGETLENETKAQLKETSDKTANDLLNTPDDEKIPIQEYRTITREGDLKDINPKSAPEESQKTNMKGNSDNLFKF